MTQATVCCLGKLPLHGDFIRFNHGLVPEIVEFDHWLLEGMERAYGARGRAFDADLRALPALRILFSSPKTGRLLNGFVLPSADQVGRSYPFVVGFAMPAPAPGPAFDRLPWLGLPSLQQLLDCVTGDLTDTTLPQFLERLQSLDFAADDNVAEQALRSYLFGTSLDALWGNWSGFQHTERRQQCLQELRQLSQPPFPPRYLTTIPTHGQPGEVAFWLTLLRQWLPVRVNPLLVAWPALSDAVGPVRLLFDELAGRYFEPAFWPEKSGSLTLDLGRSQSQRRSAPAPAGSFANILRPRALLQDVVLGATRA